MSDDQFCERCGTHLEGDYHIISSYDELQAVLCQRCEPSLGMALNMAEIGCEGNYKTIVTNKRKAFKRFMNELKENTNA